MTSYDQKPSTHRWLSRARLLAGVAAAVAVTSVAGGIAWASSNADPTPSPSASPSAPAQPGNPDHPKRGGKEFGPFGFGGALHGEFVVSKDGGGYQTVATQRGKVTAVSTDSLTVKSDDGYSRTYKIAEDTMVNAARDGIGDVKNGNTVNVFATVADGNATAVSVNDGTVKQAARDHFGFKRGPR